MKETILVAGGTGFLGYHFIKTALKKGFKVISVSQKNPSRKRFLKKVKYFLQENYINQFHAQYLIWSSFMRLTVRNLPDGTVSVCSSRQSTRS